MQVSLPRPPPAGGPAAAGRPQDEDAASDDGGNSSSASSSAGDSAGTTGAGGRGRHGGGRGRGALVQLHPLTLRITPADWEADFWREAGTPALCASDRWALPITAVNVGRGRG